LDFVQCDLESDNDYRNRRFHHPRIGFARLKGMVLVVLVFDISPTSTYVSKYGLMASISARYNYYPPCPWPEKVLGVKAHTDSSAITVLLQYEEGEGLQLLRDNQWIGVPIVRDALTINVGDQMEEILFVYWLVFLHLVFGFTCQFGLVGYDRLNVCSFSK
ncbi:non-heme dioxygenase N-terminal domain-containing protein, partial [Tanacetum coccineum]